MWTQYIDQLSKRYTFYLLSLYFKSNATTLKSFVGVKPTTNNIPTNLKQMYKFTDKCPSQTTSSPETHRVLKSQQIYETKIEKH